MSKAIRYGTKRWHAFTRFLDDGPLEIENNIAERAIRPIAIGRKNRLFALRGRRRARRCDLFRHRNPKMNGLEQQAYITDIIAKIAADWPAARWDELLPWNWQSTGDVRLAEAA